MEKLPKNWIETSLGYISEWSSGGTPKRNNAAYYNGHIPWIKTGDLNNGLIETVSEYITEEGLNNSSAKVFPKGSVAIAMYGATIGKTGLFGMDAATNQACGVAQPYLGMNKFLHYYLKSEKQAFIDKGKGGAQPNISQTVLKAHKIGLPPLAEQQRIVAKLDGLFGHLEQVKTRLDKVPQLLKNFRQAILTQAVTGKLTEEWRKGKELDEAYFYDIEKSHLSKTKPVKVRGKKGFNEELGLFEIPKNWRWISNYKLTVDGGNSICAGPFGTIFKAKDFRTEGIPIIFLRHVKPEGFNQRKPNYMDPTVWKEYHQEYSIYGGELLITKLGDPPGDATIFPSDFGVAMLTPDVMKADYNPELFNVKYASYYFNSNVCKDIISDVSFGMTRLRIDLTMFKSFPIPVPSIQEQTEIVRRVEQLFAKADKIEAAYTHLKQKVDNLPQAILAKAFKGELVEQLPTDGDAKELLSKIAALKAEAVKGKKKGRKK
ncbi:restriction endonuclease subunit S [bacterium SCSIO 12643]|nr:restriction endonuclease subunit S [bacterium SCSIO 12643]